MIDDRRKVEGIKTEIHICFYLSKSIHKYIWAACISNIKTARTMNTFKEIKACFYGKYLDVKQVPNCLESSFKLMLI